VTKRASRFTENTALPLFSGKEENNKNKQQNYQVIAELINKSDITYKREGERKKTYSLAHLSIPDTISMSQPLSDS